MIIDMSIPLNEDTEPFPDGGDPHLEWGQLATFEKNNLQVSIVKMVLHLGTHVDAPRHYVSTGKTVTGMGLESYFGEAVCIDASELAGKEHVMDLTELMAQNKDLIKPGDILIVYTGWCENFGDPVYFKHFPEYAPNTGDVLEKYGVRTIGVDTPSFDRPGTAHRAFLAKDRTIIECLLNVKQLVGKRFLFCAAPLPFTKGDGSPVRAFAVLNENE